MANICYNLVTFSGAEANLREVNSFLDDLIARSQAGRSPDDSSFIQHGKGYYSEPFRTGENSIHYRTFWQPQLEAVFDIAHEFGVTYEHHYQDLYMRLYGRATGGDGKFSNVRLEWSDFDRLGYDEDKGTYSLDGLVYKDHYSALDVLLAERIPVQEKMRFGTGGTDTAHTGR